MEQNNLPSNPAQITKELVKASFQIESTRLNYQKVLQAAENIVWTKENINEDLLAPAKFVAAKLTDKKEADKRPFIDAGKIIQTEYNSVFNPINDVISRKAEEKKVVARKIEQEAFAANAEIERQNNIKRSIISFIASITNDITEADTDKAIYSAEMRIGTELSRKNFYQEFMQNFREQCDELKPLIKKQKEYIRILRDVNKSQEAAEAQGDEAALVDLRIKAEGMKEFIDENKVRLQQKAFEQVENSDIAVGVPTAVAPNAARTWWKWRVDNIDLLDKKMPHLVDRIPNKEKIDQILADKRESGELSGKNELSFNGITFYLEKSYK